jgi:hypothetical protein
MKKLILVFSCLLALALVSIVSACANEAGAEQATLEGVLRVTRKFLYKYYIECPGTGQSCALRNSDTLEKIAPGSRIRVEGHLGTFHHAGGTKDNPSPFPAAWVMYMDVEKVTILSLPEPDQRQPEVPRNTPEDSFSRLPLLRLDRMGDLGGKRLDDIVGRHNVSRVIVFVNATSAPEQMHIAAIDRIVNRNPVIRSFYYIDPNTGNRTRSHKSEVQAFFTALLLTRDGDCVGFDLSREKARVFNNEGDGWLTLKYERPPAREKS